MDEVAAARATRSVPAGYAQKLRPRHVVLGVLVLLVVAFGLCEALGWPFLGGPIQRALSNTLDRRVSLSEDGGATPKVKIYLLRGGLTVQADYIEIAAPAWSQEPHTLLARGAAMKLGYFDLWHASQGDPLRIKSLRAQQLDSRIERLADGRASWQFGKKTNEPDTAEKPTRVPVFGRLQVESGTLSYRDALLDAKLDATYSLVEGANISSAGLQPSGSATGFKFDGQGSYKKQPVHIGLATSGLLPVIADEAGSVELPVVLDAKIGNAAMTFNGTATDALHLTALKGRFHVQGPSLAAAGDPLGVTLPSTPPFRVDGLIVKDGVVWKTVVNTAAIGSSRLAGAFTYDPRPAVPVLAGRLTGSKLLLADLGPAVGAPADKSPAVPAVAPAAPAPKAAGHVLPDKEFDLPSLRAMNANVLFDIDDFDLGSSFLEPLRPIRTHLVLLDGVLTLREIDARTGKGRLTGMLQLDGRKDLALWNADLRVAGVKLESWIHQKRGDGAPPYVSGNLTGQARVAGAGKSTAAILGSLGGGVRFQLTDGTISHLAMEAAGIDVAQALGMLVKGDDSLAAQCTVADFVADKGVLTPRVFVLDTADSTIWVDGSASLATEALDLRVVTSPKDFSPFALRSPVHLKGTFGNPSVSLEAKPIAARVGGAVLLALVTPLAAVIPLIDTGSSDEAKRGADACRKLSDRIAAKPSLPAPPVPSRTPGVATRRATS